MSKLDELIQQYCPNGVERKPLGEICKITSGEFVRKDKQVEYGFPVYNGGTSNTGYYDQYNVVGPKVIISARGAAGFVNYVKEPFWAGNSCHVMNIIANTVDVRFLYHLLKSLENKIVGKRQDGTIPSVSQQQLYGMNIPVPPLPVQREIVRILDSYTELEAELEAELLLRRQQYEWYRDHLLTFRRDVEANVSQLPWLQRLLDKYCPNGVEWKPLGSLCDIKTGKLNANAQVIDGKYPFFTCDANPFRIDTYAFDTDAILISGNGSQVGHLHRYCGKFNAYQRTYVLDAFHDISLDYLYQFLGGRLQSHIMTYRKEGSVPYITLPMLTDFMIAVPSFSVQEAIVSVLDNFSTLVTDISSGLPAEIAARRQQYEYYRDKLLSFNHIV